jgi:hypothetical protein
MFATVDADGRNRHRRLIFSFSFKLTTASCRQALLPFEQAPRWRVVTRLLFGEVQIVVGRDMKNKLSKPRQIDVVLRVPSGLPGVWSSCLIHLHPQPDSRVVEIGRTSVRVAFAAAEIRLIAHAMRRVHPRLNFKFPALGSEPKQTLHPWQE